MFYHGDAQHSTLALTDASANVLERYRYEAFGLPSIFDSIFSPLSSSLYGVRHLFQGREWLAEVKLNDHRYRHYSPEMQRWLIRDPIHEVGGINLYKAFRNAPGFYIDPFGQSVGMPNGYIDAGGNWVSLPVENALSCSRRVANEMQANYKYPMPDDNHSQLHCMTACTISQECPGGALTSVVVGILKEIFCTNNANYGWDHDSWVDIHANTLGQIASFTSQSCDCACTGKTYSSSWWNNTFLEPLTPACS